MSAGDLRSGTRSAASFVNEQGWVVGSILAGGPITTNGHPIESARRVRITAIGEEHVLGRSCLSSYGAGEGRESSLSFDCRDWTLMESPTADAHPPAPATTPGIDTPAPPTPAKPADGRTEPQGENA